MGRLALVDRAHAEQGMAAPQFLVSQTCSLGIGFDLDWTALRVRYTEGQGHCHQAPVTRRQLRSLQRKIPRQDCAGFTLEVAHVAPESERWTAATTQAVHFRRPTWGGWP